MSKRAIQQANQRVAATRVLEIPCAPADLAAAVQGLIDKWNSAADTAFETSLATHGRFHRWLNSSETPSERHYSMLKRPDHLWVTFGMSAARVAEHGFNPYSRGWIAVVVPGEYSAGRMRVTVTLAKWSVNDERLIWNGGRYVQLLDGLVAGLGGRYVSAPVDENDHHFVSRT